MPKPDRTTGLVKAGWPVTDVIRIPPTAVSGYYVAKLRLTRGRLEGASGIVPLVVRPLRSHRSPILVVASSSTWQAYNGWGGKSLYNFNSTNERAANRVSFDRPYGGSVNSLNYEHQLLRFLERESYEVVYTTDVDVDRDPGQLRRYRLVIAAGHSEYWSPRVRDAFESARAAGVNLVFLGADIADWQIRYEDGRRTIVEYRDDYAGYPGGDPEPNPSLKTTRFGLLVPPRPPCALLGVEYQGGSDGTRAYDYTVVARATDPWLRGTGLRPGATLKGAVGYEWDGLRADCPGPNPTVLFRYAGPPSAEAVRYRDPASGAQVFSSGSLNVATALDDYGGAIRADPRLQRFMRNVLHALSR
jgi:hypothetical protein